MELATALNILEQLADGVDPHTGEVFAPDSPYQHPATVRALHAALRELGKQAPAAPARAADAPRSAPPKAGKPWSDDEDKALAAAFDAGKPVPELAEAHQRSRFAIEARLAKLGRIKLPEGALRYKAKSDTAAYGAH
jgi:hypothetical protein